VNKTNITQLALHEVNDVAISSAIFDHSDHVNALKNIHKALLTF
jgi:thiamine monophosphate synthase